MELEAFLVEDKLRVGEAGTLTVMVVVVSVNLKVPVLCPLSLSFTGSVRSPLLAESLIRFRISGKLKLDLLEVAQLGDPITKGKVRLARVERSAGGTLMLRDEHCMAMKRWMLDSSSGKRIQAVAADTCGIIASLSSRCGRWGRRWAGMRSRLF